MSGTDRARTDDLLRVKQALFQLSYDPLDKTLIIIYLWKTVKTDERLCASKSSLLQENGYFVLRFLAEDLGKDLDGVLDATPRTHVPI